MSSTPSAGLPRSIQDLYSFWTRLGADALAELLNHSELTRLFAETEDFTWR